MTPLLAFLIKLPLALAVFLLIAYAGTANKRIAGVLFTFPILNGIAIIASPGPVVVADAIYPLVIFNCVLFAALLSFPQSLPPVGLLPRWSKLFARVAIWTVAWFAGAYALTDIRASIPGGAVLLVGSVIFAFVFMRIFWSGQTPPPGEAGARGHLARFIAFWVSATGFWRIAFFICAYACLFFASRAALDEKWVGMASALPLPGLFALATLIDHAEEASDAHLIAATLEPIRDTLFLGPILVIPFNCVLSHALISALPPDALALRYLFLLALWALAAFAVVLIAPRLAAHFDRR